MSRIEDRTLSPAINPARAEMEPGVHRLAPRVVHLWRVAWIGRTAAAVAAVLLLGRWIDGPPTSVLLVSAAALGLVGAVIWPPAQYRTWEYGVREREVWARRGVLSRTTSVVPLSRIQHVDTRQDVVERWLGLARVVVYTAGIRGAELTLPGLPADDAEALRDQLAALSGRGLAV